MKDNKNIVIGLLCTVLCVMAVAYATFSTTLNVEGTATIDTNWDVKIKNIECTDTAGGSVAIEKTGIDIAGTSLTATITPKFAQPGDQTVCTITVANEGDLNAYLAGVTPETVTNKGVADVTDVAEADAIHYTFDTSANGLNAELVAKTGVHTFTVTAKYADLVVDGQSVTLTDAQKSRNLVISFNYKQKLAA